MSLRNERPFVHLRVHSTYSLGVGLSSPTEICQHARRSGYDCVALTDIHGTYGFVEFHRAALASGVKPIYGAHIALDTNASFGSAETFSLLVLALDRKGLRNLAEVTSAAAQAREKGRPFSAEDIVKHGEGLAAIVGVWPAPSRRPDASPGAYLDAYLEPLVSLHTLFGERLFAEVRAGAKGIRGLEVARVAAEMGIAPVLTQDVRYVGPQKYQLIDLVASAGDRGFEHSVHSEPLGNVEGRGHGMKSSVEMSAFYDQVPEAFSNASMIAALAHPDLLDAFGLSREKNVESTLLQHESERRRLLQGRVTARLEEHRRTHPEAAKVLGERVERELALICDDVHLTETFLQFSEVAAGLRRAGVRTGPATGMRLQSLCAFLLGISTFDPYAHEPEFVPRFDDAGESYGILELQIPIEARASVMDVLERTFDERAMGYVPTVEHITAARSLRLVGERMGIKRNLYDDLVKIAAGHHGVSLRGLVEDNRRVGAMARESSVIRELISHAAAIEGLIYGFVRSRRTVIVSPHPLHDFLGFTTDPETGDRFVQATRDGFPVGRIRRIDLSALTALSVAVEVDGGDGEWVSDADEAAYALIANGDLDGIYLLESAFTSRLARRFEIRSFHDLVNFIALLRYRRGDMTFPTRVAAFRERSGPHAGHPYSGDATIHTNGWILFRDQLRDVVSQLVGCDGLEAERLLDRFRRHEPGSLASLRRAFMGAAAEHGTELTEATQWFTRLLRLADRVILRQHVIAEALLVARTLYLKSNERVRFFAAILNHTGDTARREACLQILGREGRLVDPDVNASGVRFEMENGNVRPPLYVVEGVTTKTAELIGQFNSKKTFANYEDLRCFAQEHGFAFKEIEALARAGALVSLGISPDDELPPPAPGDSSLSREPAGTGVQDQLSLELSAPVAAEPSDPTPHTGVSVQNGGNKRAYYHVVPSTAEFYPHPSASPVELAGRIRDLHFFKTSSGKTVGFFVLFDNSGFVRVFLPWESVQPGDPLNDGECVRVRGRVRARGGNRVLDALEIERIEGGITDGEATPDQSAEGDS